MNRLQKISIIIVSHNATVYLVQTLESVRAEVARAAGKCSVQTLVVDANSTDGAPKAVRNGFPNVELYSVTEPIGFSAANNLGASHADGEILFFLNPDTELLPGSLESLLHAFEKDEKNELGAVSGLLFYSDGAIQPQGGALPNLWNVAGWMLFLDDIPFVKYLFSSYQQRNIQFFEQAREVGWVGGTAFAVRASVLKEAGGWDESIFLYGEDVELCYRLKQLGYRQKIEPKIHIIHHQHKSTGGSAKSLVGEMQGLLHLWKKHFPQWQLPLLKALLMIGCLFRIGLFGILKHDAKKRQAYLEALKMVRMAR